MDGAGGEDGLIGRERGEGDGAAGGAVPGRRAGLPQRVVAVDGVGAVEAARDDVGGPAREPGRRVGLVAADRQRRRAGLAEEVAVGHVEAGEEPVGRVLDAVGRVGARPRRGEPDAQHLVLGPPAPAPQAAPPASEKAGPILAAFQARLVGVPAGPPVELVATEGQQRRAAGHEAVQAVPHGVGGVLAVVREHDHVVARQPVGVLQRPVRVEVGADLAVGPGEGGGLGGQRVHRADGLPAERGVGAMGVREDGRGAVDLVVVERLPTPGVVGRPGRDGRQHRDAGARLGRPHQERHGRLADRLGVGAWRLDGGAVGALRPAGGVERQRDGPAAAVARRVVGHFRLAGPERHAGDRLESGVVLVVAGVAFDHQRVVRVGGAEVERSRLPDLGPHARDVAL